MAEKAAVVTGATGAVGRALAAGLAAEGVRVLMLSRSAEAGTAAADAINRQGRGRAEFMQVDLASLASVRETALRCLGRLEGLDVLVNNAAVFTRRRTPTPDGLETMFAVNHLSHFLITNLLLPALRDRSGRVLNITAPSTARLDFEDLQASRRFSPLMVFGRTKTANLLFTFELARRLAGTGVTANAVHPGLVRSALMREAPAPLRWLTTAISAPPARAVQPLIALALSSAHGGKTGRFFHGAREIEPPAFARDPAAQRRLWDESARLAGLAG